MRFGKASWLLSAIVFLVMAGNLHAQQTTLDHLKDAVERGDFRTVKKLVETVPQEVLGAFFSAVEAHLEARKSGNSERARIFGDTMSAIGNAFYVGKDNRNYEKYTNFIKNMRVTALQSWLDGWAIYRKFKGVYGEAWEAKVPDAFVKAIELGGEVYPHFERINDFFLLGWVYQDIGRLHGQVSANLEAEESYKQAIEYFGYCGAEDKVTETRAFLDQLKSGQVKTAIDEEMERKDLEDRQAREEADKPLWKKVTLAYRPAKKFPFTSPNPLTTDEYINWSGNRIEPDQFGPFYDSTVFDGGSFMFYAVNDAVKLNPRTTSPIARYQFMHENKKLYLDYNDDGFATKEERIPIGGRPKFVEFDLETEDGEKFKYGVQMCELKKEKFFNFDTTYSAGNIRWQRACYMQGDDLDGQKIVLIDDNNNGTYSDYGTDSFVVGSGKTAQFLSEVISVGDKLYRIKIPNPLGTELQWMPYTDPTGKIEVKFKGKKTPSCLYVVGKGANSKTIIPLDAKNPVSVPVGTYYFYFGILKDGKGRNASWAEIRKGDSKSFEVNADETFSLELGAPFSFNYEVRTDGDQAVLRGRDLAVIGKYGEGYTRFYPFVPKGDVMVRVQKGGIVAKEKLKPIDQGVFNTGSNLAWFPRDVTWDKVAKDVEYRLRIKAKHDLLGVIMRDFK